MQEVAGLAPYCVRFRHAIFPFRVSHSGEQHTQLKIQYARAPANCCLKMAKSRQLNVDKPYFTPIKNKDDIIMYIVDYKRWQTDNGCGGDVDVEMPEVLVKFMSERKSYNQWQTCIDSSSGHAVTSSSPVNLDRHLKVFQPSQATP